MKKIIVASIFFFIVSIFIVFMFKSQKHSNFAYNSIKYLEPSYSIDIYDLKNLHLKKTDTEPYFFKKHSMPSDHSIFKNFFIHISFEKKSLDKNNYFDKKNNLKSTDNDQSDLMQYFDTAIIRSIFPFSF